MPESCVFQLDWEYLKTGLLLLNGDLRQLLPTKPDVVPVTLVLPDQQPLTTQLLNPHGALYHPELERFFRRSGANTIRVVHQEKNKGSITLFLDPLPAGAGREKRDPHPSPSEKPAFLKPGRAGATQSPPATARKKLASGSETQEPAGGKRSRTGRRRNKDWQEMEAALAAEFPDIFPLEGPPRKEPTEDDIINAFHLLAQLGILNWENVPPARQNKKAKEEAAAKRPAAAKKNTPKAGAGPEKAGRPQAAAGPKKRGTVPPMAGLRAESATRMGGILPESQPQSTAPGDEYPGLDGEFDAVAQLATQLPAPQMQFNDAAWDALLPSLAQGCYATAEEETVHQQACVLSTSPGFDTLLCLQVARDFAPYPYQVEVAREVMQRMRGRAMLCDEVGLGKTIEAGLIITEYLLRGLARKILVLCPTSLASQWAEELRSKFGLDFVLYDEPRFQNHPTPWSAFDRIIASLDMAKRAPHRGQILETFFDCVVVDEAHRCRNRTTLNWKFVNELKKKYILLLTATPVQNDLEELYNLITLLRPGQLQTASSFAATFITRGNRRKPKNAEELRRLTREVMIRNRRSTVGLSLPKRTAETILLNPTPAEAELYRQLTTYVRQEYNLAASKASRQLVLKTLQREAGSSPWAVLPTLDKLVRETKDEEAREKLTRLVQLARETREFAKGQALMRLLQTLKGEKVIVFVSFRHTQDHLAALCRENGLNFAIYHGEMRRAAKEEAIVAFTADTPVLISSESGGEGRNLQFCHLMINFDLPWNPMRIEQRIGRIHRIGQTHDVRIYNLAAVGTVESHILSLLDTKINMFELVVGELDMILGELTDEKDFEDLIMDIWAGSPSDAELARGLEELGDALARSRERYQEIKQHDMEIFG